MENIERQENPHISAPQGVSEVDVHMALKAAQDRRELDEIYALLRAEDAPVDPREVLDGSLAVSASFDSENSFSTICLGLGVVGVVGVPSDVEEKRS